jgi:hypothetical protein
LSSNCVEFWFEGPSPGELFDPEGLELFDPEGEGLLLSSFKRLLGWIAESSSSSNFLLIPFPEERSSAGSLGLLYLEVVEKPLLNIIAAFSILVLLRG